MFTTMGIFDRGVNEPIFLFVIVHSILAICTFRSRKSYTIQFIVKADTEFIGGYERDMVAGIFHL